MITTKSILPFAAILTLNCLASAQFNWSGSVLTNGTILSGGSSTPPTLPSVESRNGNYDRSIGNSWLGGSAHAYIGMVRQKSGTYELGFATAEFRGTANVLQQSREVAEIVGLASNVMNNGVQTRSGLFRVELLGYSIVNSSFTNSSTFAQVNSTFNLIPGGVSVSVPVGPISVTIGGNAGCGFSRGANWLLPAASSNVGLNANAGAYAFANASVSFGIPGFNVGVGLSGHILEQTLSGSITASPVWGLSGHFTYQLQAISLTLYAWATALWTWTTNLCSWSAGLVNLTLV